MGRSLCVYGRLVVGLMTFDASRVSILQEWLQDSIEKLACQFCPRKKGYAHGRRESLEKIADL